jgi:cytochrome b pre-mRNA-processing protein 3
LCKNVLGGENIEKARQLAAYAEFAMTALTGADEAALVSGIWKFPSPVQAGTQQ